MALNLLNSPFSEEQLKLLNELYPSLTQYQKVWLTGFLSAQLEAFEENKQTPVQEGAAHLQEKVQQHTKSATILYASQTGNSQQLAEKLTERLKEVGVQVTLESMATYKPKELKKLSNLFIVASTHGEGEPPDNAIQFYEFLYSKRAPKLDGVKFSVLALGDSSYEFFCKVGIDFDEQLEKLGAERLVSRVDCDLDYEESAQKWMDEIVAALEVSTTQQQAQPLQQSKEKAEVRYSKKNPFYAEVLESIKLNGRGSNKHTQHLELSLEGSGMTYEPGDSLGIIPENEPALVATLIETLQFSKDEIVQIEDEKVTLQDALLNRFEISVLSKPLLQKLSTFTSNVALTNLLEEDTKWKEFAYGRDLVDAVKAFGPFTWNAQQFVGILRKIPVRLYSIASSQAANEEEVHLTIGKVHYETDGRQRLGVTSGQITERVEIGDRLAVYVHKNPNFKLPNDDDTPIIMIGAGTGIAPFRSFVEDRAEKGVQGKSWLFFGEQHFMTDFYYQTDWQRWLKEGALTNLTVAFSRDTDEKIYVQHRLKENAKELYEWIEQGAVIYVCGDKNKMAKDVDSTLKEIIAEHSGKSEEDVTAFINELKQQKRYQRDVY